MFIFERQTEHEWGRGREQGRHRIWSRLRLWAVVSTEHDVGLEPMEWEIMTWAEIGQLTEWVTHEINYFDQELLRKAHSAQGFLRLAGCGLVLWLKYFFNSVLLINMHFYLLFITLVMHILIVHLFKREKSYLFSRKKECQFKFGLRPSFPKDKLAGSKSSSRKYILQQKRATTSIFSMNTQ